MTRTLLISQDIIGQRMAGPGVRYVNLAQALAPHTQLTLAAPNLATSNPPLSTSGYAFVHYTLGQWASLEALARQSDVIILPIDTASEFPQLAALNACLVIDGYDPLMAEWLALYANHSPPNADTDWRHRMALCTQPALMGDFFICASERQRDWWLGQLEAHGRLNLHTYRQDPSLRQLLDVVPFGMTAEPPPKRHKQPRTLTPRLFPSITDNDKLILWAGGLWPWLDPITAIKGVQLAYQQRPDLRFVFPGTRRPNAEAVSEIAGHFQQVYAAAEASGLLNRAIFFGDWVPYEQWHTLLRETDVALTCHHDTLETRLAYRSRTLDLMWAGVPIVSTHGDATSDLIRQHYVGLTVPYGDANAVAAALLQVLNEPIAAANFDQLRVEYAWAKVATPLIQFCQQPRRAADRATSQLTRGNPHYAAEAAIQTQNKLNQLVAERDHWHNLVRQYESGRFIRLMKWLGKFKM